jgi:hypothetical protein
VAAAIALAACGSSSPRLAPSYLYTDGYHTTMYALHVVEHDGRITGTAQALQSVTSEQAGEDSCCMRILDRYGHAVSWLAGNSKDLSTGRSDHGACGGTSACVEQLDSAITGQVGDDGRVSIHFSDAIEGGRVFGSSTTLIGERSGDTLVFDIDGTATRFRPADERSLRRARSAFYTALRTIVIPSTDLSDEAEALSGDTIQQDADALKSIVDDTIQFWGGNATQLNPYVCDFQQRFTEQRAILQDHIDFEAKEIQAARAELEPFMQPNSPRGAYGQHSGDVSGLQAAIRDDVSRIDEAVRTANTAVDEANKHKGDIINLGNGAGCGFQHWLENMSHFTPNLLAAG